MSFPYPPGTTVVPHTAFEHATDMQIGRAHV